jgi:hypothetical protein
VGSAQSGAAGAVTATAGDGSIAVTAVARAGGACYDCGRGKGGVRFWLLIRETVLRDALDLADEAES